MTLARIQINIGNTQRQLEQFEAAVAAYQTAIKTVAGLTIPRANTLRTEAQNELEKTNGGIDPVPINAPQIN